MKVALLPSAYAPAIGGVEVLTRRLALHLVAQGDEVEVWTIRHPASLPERETIDGIAVQRLELPLPSLKPGALARFPWSGAQALRRVLSAARRLRPDVLHVQCFSANGVYGLLASRMLRIPLVVTLQGETVMDDHDIYEHSALMRFALRRALASADLVTGCSSFVLRDAETRFGLPKDRGVFIPNGVDPVGGGVAVALPFERFVLGLGRLVHKKGFDLLVRAFADVSARHPDVGLVVAGEGPEQEHLSALAERTELNGRVVFPGALDREQVSAVMAAAEVFVLPSRVEPFGMVVLEAMAAGTPVIASSLGGAVEIVDNAQGLVVDPTDTAALAKAIDCLLADEQLRTQCAALGRRRAEDFAWPGVADRYRDAYRRISR